MTTSDYPEAGPGPDLRANAFVGAWERIEAAQKLKVDHKHRVVDPLPELYWATIAEAAVLAQLANADEDPGRDAGRHLLDRKERVAGRRAHFSDALRARKPKDPPFTVGHRVQVRRGDWAGRIGTVTETYPSNDPPLVEVMLDLLHLGDEPTMITVLPTDVVLGRPGGAVVYRDNATGSDL